MGNFQSKSFTYENGRNSPKFKAYKRGTIVFVNFGTSIGTELSGNHFAIVLNKNDNPFNGSLSIVPLTSKNKKYNLPLDKELISRIIDNLISKSIKIGLISDSIQSSIYNQKKNDLDSYAMMDSITTVSKYRIKKPINRMDPIGLVRVPNNILKKIDIEIIKRFTK